MEGRELENVGEPSDCSESLTWRREGEGNKDLLEECQFTERPIQNPTAHGNGPALVLWPCSGHWLGEAHGTHGLSTDGVVDPEGWQLGPLVYYTSCRSEWYIFIVAIMHILTFVSTVH